MNTDLRGGDGVATDAAARASSGPTPTVRVAVAVVEFEGRYLIGRRPAGAALEGLWEFPGGKVHDDETIEQAVARECREETGLEIEIRFRRPAVTHKYAHGRVELSFFACRPCDPSRIPTLPFQWVSRDNLPRYEFPPANAALIRDIVSGNWPPSGARG